MAGGAASEVKIGIAERRAKALDLRKSGHSYRQIAEALRGSEGVSAKYNEPAAHKDVADELARLRELSAETAKDVLELELTRLDAMILVLWPQVEKGDQFAIDRVLKIQDRRARYLGLDEANELNLNVRDDAGIENTLQRKLGGLAAANEASAVPGEPDA